MTGGAPQSVHHADRLARADAIGAQARVLCGERFDRHAEARRDRGERLALAHGVLEAFLGLFAVLAPRTVGGVILRARSRCARDQDREADR